MSVIQWAAQRGRHAPSIGYAADGIVGAGVQGRFVPPPAFKSPHSYVGARVMRPRVQGRIVALAKTGAAAGAVGVFGSLRTSVRASFGPTTLQFGNLGGVATQASILRSIVGRSGALGRNATSKAVGFPVGGRMHAKAQNLNTLAAGIASNVRASSGMLGQIATRKAMRTSMAGRVGSGGANAGGPGERKFASVAARLGVRSQNTSTGGVFIRRHVRDQIRDQYVAALKIAVPEVDNRVFPARVYPIARGEFPGIVVRSADDVVVESTLGEPQILIRELTLEVQAIALAADDLDGALDDLATSIEAALSDDQLVSGLAKESDLTETQFEMIDGEQPLGAVTLTYRIRYVITEDKPWLAL